MKISERLRKRKVKIMRVAKIFLISGPVIMIIGIIVASINRAAGLNLLFNIIGLFVLFVGGFLWLRSDPVYSKHYQPED